MKPENKPNPKHFEKILGEKSQVSKRRVKNSIQFLNVGDYYRGIVKIVRKIKPGPIIITIFDGTGSIDAVIHDRIFQVKTTTQEKNKTYDFGNLQIKDSRKKNINTSTTKPEEKEPSLTADEIQVDQVVKIFGKVNTHRDALELEVKTIRASTMDFETILNDRSISLRDTFSIESERYDSMKIVFLNIAQRIRRAIIEQQPILIRHHNDADGICSGLAIEQAILNVMGRYNINSKNKLYRSPSVSPFYDQIDLFRDISKFSRYTVQFGDKSPLILLLDTGSTPENLFALQILQSFDFECIIIDHHNPGKITEGKSSVCDLLQFHLNPYLFGWDSQTSGGMLCYELARFVDEDYDNPLYPVVAGYADRCDIPEVAKLLENSHKSDEEIIQIGKVIDYMAYNFRFDSGDAVYEKVFTNPKLVQVIGDKLKTIFDETLTRILPRVESKDINGILYTEVDLELNTQRGKYPTPGKVLGMVHDHLGSQNDSKIVFTAGFFSDGIIIRATHPILPVPDLLKDLQQQMPEANVDGGGHEQAGSLKFIPAYKEKISEYVQNQLLLQKLDKMT